MLTCNCDTLDGDMLNIMDRNFTAPERETLIRWSDDDELVEVWTAQRPVITKLRANPAYTEVASGDYGSSSWACFTIPAERFTFGAKRVYGAETRAKMAERGFSPRKAS